MRDATNPWRKDRYIAVLNVYIDTLHGYERGIFRCNNNN